MTPMLPDALLRAQSDERLLILATRGNERAFEALVRRYRTPLVRFCRNMVRDHELAEDVVQQALMSAWNALRNGTEVREIRPWLYCIVRHAAVRALHSSRHARDARPLSDSLAERDTPEQNLQRRTAIREALAEVATLPDMQREALLLTVFAGHSNAAAARELGVTDSIVRGLLYRARVQLRAACSAITPPILLQWAANRLSHGAREVSTRLAEAGAGSASTGGAVALLAKGGVVALSAIAVTVGTVHVTTHVHTGDPRARVAPHAGSHTNSGTHAPLSSAAAHGPDGSTVLVLSAIPSAQRGRTGGRGPGRSASGAGGRDTAGPSGPGGDGTTSGSGGGGSKGSTGGPGGDGGSAGSGSTGGPGGDGSSGGSGDGNAANASSGSSDNKDQGSTGGSGDENAQGSTSGPGDGGGSNRGSAGSGSDGASGSPSAQAGTSGDSNPSASASSSGSGDNGSSGHGGGPGGSGDSGDGGGVGGSHPPSST